jgi:ABC-type multidrug transport system ATPase subunit
VNRILVVENGKIRLDGTYEQLLADEYFKKVMETMHKQDKEDEDENSSASESCEETKQKKNFLSQQKKELLTKEDDEDIAEISMKTYFSYYWYAKKGLPAFFVSLCILFTMRIIQMKNDYYILEWVKTYTQEGILDYSTLYLLIGLIVG